MNADFYGLRSFKFDSIKLLNNYQDKIKYIEQEQKEFCRKYEADFQPINFDLRFGFSDNFFSGIIFLNGLRHPQDGNMCGWYFWASEEFSEADDFFKSMHIYHLIDRSPNLLKYLALPTLRYFIGRFQRFWLKLHKHLIIRNGYIRLYCANVFIY